MNKKELIDLLIQNRFQDLFDHLKEIAAAKKRGNLLQDVILLEAQYTELKQDELRENQEDQAIQIRYNKLRERLQDYINLLFRPITPLMQRKRFWIPVAFFISGIALFWWGLSPSEFAQFELKANLSSISFRLEDTWDFDYDLYLKQFEAYPILHLRTNEANYTEDEYGAFGVALNRGHFQLSTLKLEKGTRVHVRSDGPDLIFNIDDQSLAGEIEVDSARFRIDEIPIQTSFSSSNFIDFKTVPSSEMAITPAQADQFQMKLLKVGKGWDYTLQNEDGSPESTIKSGTINASGIKDTLLEGQMVEMEALQNGNLDIKKAGDDLEITLRGLSKGLKIGDQNLLQNRQPTRIELLIKNPLANLGWKIVMGALTLFGAVFGLVQVIKSLQGN